MLVLSRKPGEQIVLPDIGIRVTVLNISGRRVRLGIEGPPTTAVHRAEVWQRMQEFSDPAPRSAAAPRTRHRLAAR
ncbi:MAG: carbon storage regulator [Pirellulales bacterium]|nr:carbon storage regulator [Pirellulales bacterium]